MACLEGKRYGQEKVEPVGPRPKRADEGGDIRMYRTNCCIRPDLVTQFSA